MCVLLFLLFPILLSFSTCTASEHGHFVLYGVIKGDSSLASQEVLRAFGVLIEESDDSSSFVSPNHARSWPFGRGGFGGIGGRIRRPPRPPTRRPTIRYPPTRGTTKIVRTTRAPVTTTIRTTTGTTTRTTTGTTETTTLPLIPVTYASGTEVQSSGTTKKGMVAALRDSFGKVFKAVGNSVTNTITSPNGMQIREVLTEVMTTTGVRVMRQHFHLGNGMMMGADFVGGMSGGYSPMDYTGWAAWAAVTVGRVLFGLPDVLKPGSQFGQGGMDYNTGTGYGQQGPMGPVGQQGPAGPMGGPQVPQAPIGDYEDQNQGPTNATQPAGTKPQARNLTSDVENQDFFDTDTATSDVQRHFGPRKGGVRRPPPKGGFGTRRPPVVYTMRTRRPPTPPRTQGGPPTAPRSPPTSFTDKLGQVMRRVGNSVINHVAGPNGEQAREVLTQVATQAGVQILRMTFNMNGQPMGSDYVNSWNPGYQPSGSVLGNGGMDYSFDQFGQGGGGQQSYDYQG
ncbi:unnamed protein product [Caenorhabditis sp. 36 PRJEB53466]|nr:unnamed protein product [Caenorhabditis sp. 36 PRJEB53466]